jgi:quinol---cytochrome c reductase iron-sulfur subunit, bacillus type
VAISNRCTHVGCPVRYAEAAGMFLCPCHGGVYGARGQVTGGPPVRPLDRFYTRVVNGRVEVGARFSLDSHFNRFPHPRDPSQHLDGLWKYLYPARPTT